MTDQSKIQIICEGECLDTESYGAQAYISHAWTIRLNDDLIAMWQDWRRKPADEFDEGEKAEREATAKALQLAFHNEIAKQLGLNVPGSRLVITQVLSEIITVLLIVKAD